MKIVRDIATGEVKAGGADCVLRSNAIGSCIVVTAYDPVRVVGALAHIMLPGSAPDDAANKTRYAFDAIDKMLRLLATMQAATERLECCLVGGGNILKRPDDTICTENLRSVEEILKERNLTIVQRAVGGTTRRTGLFDIETGSVFFTEGNSRKLLLWKAGSNDDKTQKVEIHE